MTGGGMKLAIRNQVPLRAEARMGHGIRLSQATVSDVAAPSNLAADQAAEYSLWGPQEKTLFLLAYQWIAAATSPSLQIQGENASYVGLLPHSMDTVMGFLTDAVGPLLGLNVLSADDVSMSQQLTNEVSQSKTDNDKGQNFTQQYQTLRNQAVNDLFVGGATVRFEYFGDNPDFPGQLVTYTRGHAGQPIDVDAVFSGKSPSDLISDGQTLEDKFQALGVPFQPAVMSGRSHRNLGAANFPILGLAIAIIAGILGWFWLYWKNLERQGFRKTIDKDIDQIADPAQRAKARAASTAADSLISQFFGQSAEWIIFGVLGVIAAVFLFPVLFPPKQQKVTFQARTAGGLL